MQATLRDQIEKRAYALFLERGGTHGYAMEDWIRAEKEIAGSGKKKTTGKRIKESTAK
jgi:hypothetical protein